MIQLVEDWRERGKGKERERERRETEGEGRNCGLYYRCFGLRKLIEVVPFS